VLWLSDHFLDGWDIAVLTVRAPDRTNDSFHPHCDQVITRDSGLQWLCPVCAACYNNGDSSVVANKKEWLVTECTARCVFSR
jgi:hypothetical protein